RDGRGEPHRVARPRGHGPHPRARRGGLRGLPLAHAGDDLRPGPSAPPDRSAPGTGSRSPGGLRYVRPDHGELRALGVLRELDVPPRGRSRDLTPLLDAEERRDLLRLARAAIRQAIAGGDALTRLLGELPISAAMQAPRGAFVSLHALDDDGGAPRLRGCIGSLATDVPLHETVMRVAPRAARHDPRFPPLRLDELDRLVVEISALGPLRPLRATERIALGLHGVRLEKGD